MRIAYVSRSDGVHDRRFRSAWESVGCEVVARTWNDPDSGAELARWLHNAAPDLVQAGPVTWPADQVAAVWDGPLIAASWGFDLMDEALRDSTLRDRARSVLARADLVFIDNDAVRSEAETLGAPADVIEMFPWGLSESWLQQPVRRGSDEARVLSTRRHEALYRVGDLVAAFLALAPDFPHLRLSLAGEGSLTPSLREEVDAAELGSRVKFLGELSEPQLRQAYLEADLYVSTSGVDGSSISLLEAMASGVPVLVADIPGNAQWVAGDAGRTFAAGDVDDLKQKLLEWLTTPGERRAASERAERAARRVREHANWKSTVQRFPEFARRAIEKSRARMSGDAQ